MSRGLPPPKPTANDLVLEWRGTLGPYAKAALLCGTKASMLPARGAPGREASFWPVGVQVVSAKELGEHGDSIGTDDVEARNAPDGVLVLAASLTMDQGEEARRFAAVALRRRAWAVVADAPEKAVLQPAVEGLSCNGYVVSTYMCQSSRCGDRTARRRQTLLAVQGGLVPEVLDLAPTDSLRGGEAW